MVALAALLAVAPLAAPLVSLVVAPASAKPPPPPPNPDALPGPITNDVLMASATKPHPNLKLGESYVGVSGALWGVLLKRYGGGPEIRRTALDLYEVPPDLT